MSADSFCHLQAGDPGTKLQEWFAREPGRRVLLAEKQVLSGMTMDLFGYELLQLNHLGNDLRHLEACSIREKRVLGPDSGNGYDLQGDVHHLPVATDSIDTMVLPHTLDFSHDPQQVLREVERVLIPEGRVIITGFNPFSFWGLWRLFLRWRGTVPWCGHFLSYRRLHDWLNLLGFDVERTDACEFRPPLKFAGIYQRLGFIEDIGRRIWPMFAGVYSVRAVKRVSTVRPIRPGWKRLRVFAGQAIEPTTRETAGNK